MGRVRNPLPTDFRKLSHIKLKELAKRNNVCDSGGRFAIMARLKKFREENIAKETNEKPEEKIVEAPEEEKCAKEKFVTNHEKETRSESEIEETNQDSNEAKIAKVVEDETNCEKESAKNPTTAAL